MNWILNTLKTLSIVSITLGSVYATPQSLIVHNLTDVQSETYIDGVVPPRNPTQPYSTSSIPWEEVKIGCIGHTFHGKCRALIKLATNTFNPINLGWMSVDLVTGDIRPKEIKMDGYHLYVNGPGEATIKLPG